MEKKKVGFPMRTRGRRAADRRGQKNEATRREKGSMIRTGICPDRWRSTNNDKNTRTKGMESRALSIEGREKGQKEADRRAEREGEV